MFFLSSYDHFQRKLIIIAKSQGFFPWLFLLSWEQRKLGEVVKEVTRNDPTSEAPIMMITANNGFIEQSERYAFDNAGESLKKYILLQKGELAYNHGASKLRPFGSCFALTTAESARIPFVYHCFSAENQNAEFLSIELNGSEVESQLRKIVSSGARMDGLLNISFDEYSTVTVLLPDIKEQEHIADFFRNLDHLITLHQHEPLFLVMLFSGGSCVFKSAWEQRKLCDYLTTSTEKNISGLYTKEDVLSVSGDVGIVNQIEFQGRSFAGASVLNYGIVETGDVVYTKSPLRSNPYGIIKANKGKPGIVSTLYAIYHPSPLADPDFIQCYFEQDARVNNYLHPLVNKGAKNDMKVSADNALKGIVRFPSVKEQQTISAFFKSLDDLITLHQRKGNQREIKSLDFAWEQRKLGDCFTERCESMPDGELISVTINDGIKKFSELGRHDNSNDDKSKYKKVCAGDIAYNSMRMWQGASGCSPYEGIVSPAYTVLTPNSGINSKCMAYQFKLPATIHTFKINSQGITSDNWNLKFPALSEIEIYVSPYEQEQAKIAAYFANLDHLITLHQRERLLMKGNRSTEAGEGTHNQINVLILQLLNNMEISLLRCCHACMA